ncbi:MAG: peptidoglycan DD-metalloendopeptidase family protein [Betaproteobacteria bacterium]
MALIVLTGFLAACRSTPTAVPVIERSPNAGPAAKARAVPPVESAPAANTQSQASSTAPVSSPAIAAPVITNAKPEHQPAPLDEPETKPYREGDWRPEFHVVKKGDTLYSIALDYGQDYRELAAWNNLADPGVIRIDQRLRLFPPDSFGEATIAQPTPLAATVTAPLFSEPKARKLPYSEQALAQLKMPLPALASVPPVAAPAKPSAKSPTVVAAPPAPPTPKQKDSPGGDGKIIWEWPAQGKLLYGFGQGPNQKGVGIEGRIGQPVLAAAPGKVVYSGSGLRGYGKLIIIKHNASYLSVYAHNSQILVKEGQTVAKGQKIAEIGDTDSDRMALHFEIRRLGKPIDPLQYLPGRPS